MKLSIIVPAYNEEIRLGSFAKKLFSFIDQSEIKGKIHEIIFVNDGSKDGTLGLMKKIISDRKDCRIISYTKNRGKGGAVRQGVLSAKGKKVIFIDADGSISPDEIPKMQYMLDKYDCVVGTRYVPGARRKQPLTRRITSWAFNKYTRMLFGLNVTDTLCGFKGFRRETAIKVFTPLISTRFIFDVELFFRMRRFNISVHQMPIVWEHKPGSKMKLTEMFKMAFELLSLRIKLVQK